MNLIAVAELPAEAFAPFGEVGAPPADGGHAAGDLALELSRGTPWFNIMRLAPAMPLTTALSPRAGRGRDPRSGRVRGGERWTDHPRRSASNAVSLGPAEPGL